MISLLSDNCKVDKVNYLMGFIEIIYKNIERFRIFLKDLKITLFD